jgi:hypothetical protein
VGEAAVHAGHHNRQSTRRLAWHQPLCRNYWISTPSLRLR